MRDMRVIGFTAGGRPVYEIAGGDGTGDPAATAGAAGGAGGSGSGSEPDFKSEAEKWKALSRKHEAEAKKNADAAQRLKDAEDTNKTELQKIMAKLDASEKRAAEAEQKALRAEVAQAKGLTAAQARRLQGSTQEELESDADDLISTFKIENKPAGDAGANGAGAGKTTRPPGGPKESLKGGGAGTAEVVETDPRKLAKMIHGES